MAGLLASEDSPQVLITEIANPVRHLTRHEISDRWRGRVWPQVECGSHLKWKRGVASGSLHRVVRPRRRIAQARE
jgi:hypothetical protein